MSLQYEPVIDELSDEYPDRPELYFMRSSHRRERRWPRVIGIVQIIVGVLIAFLGALECFIIPMAESKDYKHDIRFDQSTCYGAGLIAGFVMVLTGSTAIRASLSKRKTTVYRFYNLTLFTLLLYIGMTVFLIVAYANGWTNKKAYPEGSHMHQVHMFVTIFTVLGLLFALTAVVLYYDVVCCGENKLWEWWATSLCSACYGK
ncbi:hypothetical protein BaRGS_00033172, partial [Batillaria attramentaria]